MQPEEGIQGLTYVGGLEFVSWCFLVVFFQFFTEHLYAYTVSVCVRVGVKCIIYMFCKMII